MADPNRKINLDLSSDEDSEGPELELELDPSEVTLVKEFEEEFKTRFSHDDKAFQDFFNQKAKPPPIVYPFDGFNQHHHHHRGGNRGGGGRYQNYGNRRNNYDGGGGGGYRQHQQHNHSNRNDNRPPFKRARTDSNPSRDS